jgi:C-terminal processing protease CtpA/Prc
MATKILCTMVALMAAALVACGIVIALDRTELNRLRADNAALESGAQDTARLKEENRALRHVQADADELERLRRQTQEIHRLRSQYRELQELQQDYSTLLKEHQQLEAVHQQLAGQQQVLRSQLQSFAAAGAARQNQTAATPSGAWLGVSIQTLTENPQAQQQNPGVSQGVVIAAVIPDTPAEMSGLEPGDIIIAIDGETITTAAQVRELMTTKQVGQRLVVDIYRNGLVHKLGVDAAPIPRQ